MAVIVVLRSHEEIGFALREELAAAERELRQAAAERAAEAEQRFQVSLRRFTGFVFHGRVPKELRCA